MVIEMKKLVISDWSGTISLDLDMFDKTYRETVRELFGIEGSMYDDPNYSASTNIGVVSAIARIHGVPEEEIKSKEDSILPIYKKTFLEVLERNELNVLPGVRELFHELRENKVPLGLISGETRTTLDALLKKANLDVYFTRDMRSCGEEVSDRTELIKLAIKRAERKYGVELPRNKIYLLDDSVRGIEAGKSLGIVAISVATGPTCYEELHSNNPSYIFHNLKDYTKVLEIILG